MNNEFEKQVERQIAALDNRNPLTFVNKVCDIFRDALTDLDIGFEERDAVIDQLAIDLRQNQIAVFGPLGQASDFKMRPLVEYVSIRPNYVHHLLRKEICEFLVEQMVANLELKTWSLIEGTG